MIIVETVYKCLDYRQKLSKLPNQLKLSECVNYNVGKQLTDVFKFLAIFPLKILIELDGYGYL